MRATVWGPSFRAQLRREAAGGMLHGMKFRPLFLALCLLAGAAGAVQCGDSEEAPADDRDGGPTGNRQPPQGGGDAAPDVDLREAGPSTIGQCGAATGALAFGGNVQTNLSVEEYVSSLAFDGMGRLWLTGSLIGTPTLVDAGGDAGAPNRAMAVLRVGSNGTADIVRVYKDESSQVGGVPLADGRSVAVQNDTIVVAGRFAGVVDFGQGDLTSASGAVDGGDAGVSPCSLLCESDAVVLKLDATGSTAWSRRFGGPGADSAFAVAIGPAGEIVVVGSYEGMVDFDGTTLPGTSGGRDAFVTKLDTNGNVVWAKSLGGAGDDDALAVAIDETGKIIVGGAFSGTLDALGTMLTTPTPSDGFVVELAPDGSKIDAFAFGASERSAVTSVAARPSDGRAFGGFFRGTMQPFGSAMMSRDTDGFVVDRRADGSTVLALAVGGEGIDDVSSVASGPNGRLVVSGTTSSQLLDLGGGAHYSPLSADAFIGVYDSAGAHVCSRRYPSTPDSSARAVAIDPTGRTAYGGRVYGLFAPEPFQVKSVIGQDAWAVLFGP